MRDEQCPKQIATERLYKTFCRFKIAKPKDPSITELLDALSAALASNVYNGTGLELQVESLDTILRGAKFDGK